MIHFGILGAGKIAHRFMQGIELCEDAVVDIVYTRKKAKGLAFIEEFNISQAVDDVDELLRSEIDAIYVATPHFCHAADIMKCLQAGKHVLCEKPMFVDLNEADEVFNYAKAHHLLVMEAMKLCFLPTTLLAKQWLKEGKIGKLLHLQATFCRKEIDHLPPDSYLWDLRAGGATFDVGCYPIAFCNFMMDEKPIVTVTELEMLNGVDVSASYLLDYGDVKAEVSCSFAYSLDNAATFIGDKGKIVIKDFWKANQITYLGEQEETIVYEAVPEFKYEIEHFCKCIQNKQNESDFVSHAFTKMNLECMLKGK